MDQLLLLDVALLVMPAGGLQHTDLSGSAPDLHHPGGGDTGTT
jgi:hypothetical protein